MARTMKWPPVPVNGRIPFVEGIDATAVLVVSTLSDLTQNPFNPPALSLGEVTYRSSVGSEARLRATLERLRSVILVESLEEVTSDEDASEGRREFFIAFSDRETRQRTEVTING